MKFKIIYTNIDLVYRTTDRKPQVNFKTTNL